MKRTTSTKIVVFRDGNLRIGRNVPEAEAKRAILQKILGNIRVTERGCWEWTAYCNPTWGYGEVGYRGRVWRVHRLMWTLTRGPIVDDKLVCHECDNPPCCNPDHLWLGTDQQNHQDKARKNRHHYGKLTHCTHGHEFTPENTEVRPVKDRPGLFRRQCKECLRLAHQKPEHIAWRREYQRKRRALKRAQRQTEAAP